MARWWRRPVLLAPLGPITAGVADGPVGNNTGGGRSADQAWRIWRSVPEVHFSTSTMARQVGRLRWDVTIGDADEPLPQEESDRIIAEVTYPHGPEFVSALMALHRQVAGEYWYCRYEPTEERPNGGWEVKASKGSGWGQANEGSNVEVFTINRDPAKPQQADSPVLATLDVSIELLLLRALSRSQARSRTGQRGIILYPQETTFPGDYSFKDELQTAITAALRDEHSAGAVVPATLPVPAEHIDKWKHLTFESAFDKDLPNRIEALIRQLALGLDSPPEVLLGMSDSNHWSAASITDEIYRAHVAPLAEWPAWTFARAIEAASGLETGSVLVEPDPTELVRRRPTVDEVLRYFEAGLVSEDYALAAIGAGEEDKPVVQLKELPVEVDTALDLARNAPSLVQNPGLPELVRQIKQILANDIPTEPPAIEGSGEEVGGEEAPASPPPESTPEVAASAHLALVAAGGVTRAEADALSEDLARVDQTLMTAATAASEAALFRARQQAGAKLRTALRGDPRLEQIDGVPNEQVAATLPEEDVRQLLGDWTPDLSILGDQFGRQIGQAWRSAGELVGQPVCDPSNSASVCSSWLAEGTTLLVQLVGDHTLATLTQATPLLGALSEAVRRASTLSAGGHDPVTAAVAPPSPLDGSGPATSRLTMQTIRQLTGLSTQQWRWVYGNSFRDDPHPKHRSLAGTFAGVDGIVQSEGITWFPGDHKGCLCVLAPAFTLGGIA